ncbi:hypothetical protein IJ182_06710 [bacterium]|nr:hypothetical protein [bacterium]
MDNLYYVLIVQSVVIFSIVISIIFIVFKLLRKSKFTKKDYLLILILILCTYMYIPFAFYRKGLENNYEEKYQDALKYYDKAYKLSFLPFEKRMFKFDTSTIYYFYDKNGNQAIEDLEYALNGDYSHPVFLPQLYFLKGDYNKVADIENIAENSEHYYSALSFIMQDEYAAALDILLRKEQKNYNNFMLISALYNELNEPETASKYHQTAIDEFSNINFADSITEDNKRQELMTYANIQTFKEFINNQRKAYQFE